MKHDKEVIIIADSDPRTKIVGGVGIYSYNLAENLSKQFEILYVGKKQSMKQIQKVPYKVKIVNKSAEENNIKFYFALKKIAKNLKTTQNTIIHAQRPDWLVPFSKLKGKKIFTLHGSHFKNMQLKKGKLLQLLYSKLEKKGFEVADKIISVDTQTKKEYKERYPLHAKKIITIPVGVDTNLFKPIKTSIARKKLGLPQNKTIYLCVSRFSKEKRIDAMITATKKDELLIIIGSGEEEKKIRELASNKKDYIKIINPKTSKELINYYCAADAFLIFSTHEGLTTTALESLACGTPVVSTKVGDLQKIITIQNGVLIENKDFRTAMNTIIGKKKKMTKSCRNTALNYDWKEISERIIKEVYK